MKKESKMVILYLSLVGTIFIANYLISIIMHPAKVNYPIYYRSGECITVLFLLGYILYSWRSDLPEFLKRMCLSIPIALVFSPIPLVFSVFANTLDSAIYISLFTGVSVFLLLLLKTPNWKQHVSTILIASCIFIVLAKFYFMPLEKWHKISFVIQGLIFLGFMLIVSFFLLYLSILFKQEFTPDIKAIIIRSVKFGLALSLFFAAYLVLNRIGDRLGLSLPVQFLLNTLLSILFLVTCYTFDLLLIERKSLMWKKGRRSKLKNELEEFYLNEREKTKMNQ